MRALQEEERRRMESTPILDWPVNTSTFDPKRHAVAGRRLRVLAELLLGYSKLSHYFSADLLKDAVESVENKQLNFGQVLNILEDPKYESARAALESLPLRYMFNITRDEPAHAITEIPEGYDRRQRDPELHFGLQDLGYSILWDMHTAGAAIKNPDLYFPGIDEGIVPVSDDHVRFVIWGMQRELDRELRTLRAGESRRPSLPLSELPWRIQRALVERRRWHYAQYGIGREEWVDNRWSVWNVVEDSKWMPPWVKKDE